MASTSASSPSEGEIVESESNKATTSLAETTSNNVDRQSRKRSTVSISPVSARSSRRQSRSASPSPYRESRGSKRRYEDDHYSRGHHDPRRFKIAYDDRRYDHDHGHSRSYRALDTGSGRAPYHDSYEVSGRSHVDRRRRRSRSPVDQYDRGWPSHNTKDQDYNGRRLNKGSGRGTNTNGDNLSEQERKDKGSSSLSNGTTIQTGSGDTSTRAPEDKSSAKHAAPDDSHPTQSSEHEIVDEASLIEARRKRREAIKARYKGHSSSASIQAAVSEDVSQQTTPTQELSRRNSQTQIQSELASTENDVKTVSPRPIADASGQESPKEFLVTKDTDLINNNTVADGLVHGDEPSAADYDPKMDMQEDKLRQGQDQTQADVSAASYKEEPATLPASNGDKESKATSSKTKDPGELDMFGDGDDFDMFADAPTGPQLLHKGSTDTEAVTGLKALNVNMIDDWDDPEGYYKVILGELLDKRYHVQSNLGKGMFSGVVRATDQNVKRLVAIKIVRNNETMRKAGLQEMEILQKLSNADPENKKHIVRLERCFEHKGHLCMVFENLSIDLREVLKKFGRDVGINLKAVREYARQMFLGLSLLRKCNILHADLKPDNILVNESRSNLKICDLGSAADASESEITRYLVSRFYRAPEIILGLPYDFAIDMWSIGCTLFELYTGKILFTGRSNNQMLRVIMECRGKFNSKLLRKAEFAGLYFDGLLNFRSVEKDKLTGKDVVRMLNFTKPTRDLKTRVMANVKGVDEAELKDLNLFVDLLDKCLNIHPEKRCTPSEALKHPFILRARA